MINVMIHRRSPDTDPTPLVLRTWEKNSGIHHSCIHGEECEVRGILGEECEVRGKRGKGSFLYTLLCQPLPVSPSQFLELSRVSVPSDKALKSSGIVFGNDRYRRCFQYVSRSSPMKGKKNPVGMKPSHALRMCLTASRFSGGLHLDAPRIPRQQKCSECQECIISGFVDHFHNG